MVLMLTELVSMYRKVVFCVGTIASVFIFKEVIDLLKLLKQQK